MKCKLAGEKLIINSGENMNLSNNKCLLYSTLFLLIGILSVIRNESIPSIASLIMSVVFFVMHLIVKLTDGNKNLNIQVNN